MSVLENVAAQFEQFAETIVDAAVEEASDVGTKLTAIAAEALDEGEEVVEEAFADLVEKVGEAATKFVTNLFANDTLSGTEKANLAATQLVQHATTSGITIAAHDVTTIIKSAFLAVKDKVASL